MHSLKRFVSVVPCAFVDVMRSALLDLRYGRWIGGRAKLKPISHREVGAYGFTNTSYKVLQQIFRGRIAPNDVMVDVGSGRGRVLNYWLYSGHRGRIYGLELDEEYAKSTRRRLANWSNVHILHGDAISNLPPEGTLFFLFNPFDIHSMRRFRDTLLRVSVNPERIRVVYYAPTCIEAWTEDSRWMVQQYELNMNGVSQLDARYRIYAIITARNCASAVVRAAPNQSTGSITSL